MIKGKLLLVLFVLVMLPSVVSAQIRWEQAQRYRFYGVVDFSYKNYNEEVNGVKGDEKSYGMQYRLGLSGYIWRPRLAIFSSDVSFAMVKQTPKSDDRNLGFSFNAIFFPITRFPLFLSASRYTSNLDGNLGYNNTTTSTQYSANWYYSSLTHKTFEIRHLHLINDTDYQSTGKVKNVFDYLSISLRGSPYFDRRSLYNNFRNNNRNSNSNMPKKNNDNSDDNSEDEGKDVGKNNVNLKNNVNSKNLGSSTSLENRLGISWGVQYELQNHKTDSASLSETEKSQRLSLFASRDLFNFFSAHSDLVFYKTDTDKDTYLTFNLYRQTEKFYSYNSYAFSNLDDQDVKSTTHDIRTSNIYHYSKELTFNGNVTYNRYTKQNEATITKYEADLGANYNYAYAKHFDAAILTAYAGTGLTSSMNSNTKSSSHSYAVYLGYGSRYETYQKTNGLFSYTYYADLVGTADSKGSLHDSLTIGVSASRAFRKFSITSSANIGYTINKPHEGVSSNGLSFGLNAGLYARPTRYSTFSATAQYSATRSDSSTYNTLTLIENLNINLYRNLDLNVAATQIATSSDSTNSLDRTTTTYNQILTSLNYRIRKLYLHGEYNISSQDDNGSIIKKRVIFLRATRPF